MSEKSAHELLEKVFSVVVKEAKSNPGFAQKMLEALPAEAVAKAGGKPVGRKRKKDDFDVGKYHAVNILRQYGEGVLEGRLNEVKKDDLKKVAAYSGLKLTGPAAKKAATKAVIIEGIVLAAKRYVEQRNVAAA